MDNKCKKITCKSMERTNLRQLIEEINIMIKTLSTVHFPNELKQKRTQYRNWSCNNKLLELSPTFNLSYAFHTIF